MFDIISLRLYIVLFVRNLKICHDFVVKRNFGGLRGRGIHKLSFAPTFKLCKNIRHIGTSLSRVKKNHGLSWKNHFSIITNHINFPTSSLLT